MTWWCSATGDAWSWSWQWYPGVWLFVATLLLGYRQANRRWPTTEGERRWPWYFAGTLVLWFGADWPIGRLGAGYLVSVHTIQYILFALVVPPLLLHGTSREVLRGLATMPALRGTVSLMSRPLVAFAVFNLVIVGTHLPAVVDGLTTSQLGSFAIDIAWLGSGLLFWWQVLAPLPEVIRLSYPGRIVFVILNVFIPTVPAAFLTFADYPIYALYELAPPIGSITPRVDQQVAGLIMKTLGGFTLFGTATVMFFKWHREEVRVDERQNSAG